MFGAYGVRSTLDEEEQRTALENTSSVLYPAERVMPSMAQPAAHPLLATQSWQLGMNHIATHGVVPTPRQLVGAITSLPPAMSHRMLHSTTQVPSMTPLQHSGTHIPSVTPLTAQHSLQHTGASHPSVTPLTTLQHSDTYVPAMNSLTTPHPVQQTGTQVPSVAPPTAHHSLQHGGTYYPLVTPLTAQYSLQHSSMHHPSVSSLTTLTAQRSTQPSGTHHPSVTSLTSHYHSLPHSTTHHPSMSPFTLPVAGYSLLPGTTYLPSLPSPAPRHPISSNVKPPSTHLLLSSASRGLPYEQSKTPQNVGSFDPLTLTHNSGHIRDLITHSKTLHHHEMSLQRTDPQVNPQVNPGFQTNPIPYDDEQLYHLDQRNTIELNEDDIYDKLHDHIGSLPMYRTSKHDPQNFVFLPTKGDPESDLCEDKTYSSDESSDIDNTRYNAVRKHQASPMYIDDEDYRSVEREDKSSSSRSDFGGRDGFFGGMFAERLSPDNGGHFEDTFFQRKQQDSAGSRKTSDVQGSRRTHGRFKRGRTRSPEHRPDHQRSGSSAQDLGKHGTTKSGRYLTWTASSRSSTYDGNDSDRQDSSKFSRSWKNNERNRKDLISKSQEVKLLSKHPKLDSDRRRMSPRNESDFSDADRSKSRTPQKIDKWSYDHDSKTKTGRENRNRTSRSASSSLASESGRRSKDSESSSFKIKTEDRDRELCNYSASRLKGDSSRERKEYESPKIRMEQDRNRRESSSRSSSERKDGKDVQSGPDRSRDHNSQSRDRSSSRSKSSHSQDDDHIQSTSGTRSPSRALRCHCLPEPDIPRNITYQKNEKYYATRGLSSSKSTCVATADVVKVHKEFEEKIFKTARTSSQTAADIGESDVPEAAEMTTNDNQYVSELLDKPDCSDESSDDESELDLDGYITIDESGSDDDDDDVSQTVRRPRDHHNNLHPELWFNVSDELNHGRECLCSARDKAKWIVHGVYPYEQMPEPCEPLGNNGLKLYHYWVTVKPQTNFMTERPSTIESGGETYTFEGFSLLTHSSLDAIPECSLTRFNIKYDIMFLQEPIPNNFCIRDLDLFSKYLFHDILEMYDWDVSNKGNEEHCNLFHFLPRFTRNVGVSANGIKKVELLSMRKVFEHLIKNRQPLTENIQSSSRRKSCVNSIVTKPGAKPTSLRVDEIDERGKEDAVIIHHGIRPVQLSFSGDLKCQRLMKLYLKLRHNVYINPDASQKDRLNLIKMKLRLDNMRMKDALRRDCCVRLSARGMFKTGLNSDITQHALLLPVLVHHVRYHLTLQTFDEKLGYQFKDRALLQLAFTHPSYVLNYGTNPDHARNTLSNCGVKKPRYGDKRNRFKYTKKKGIVHLIDIMSKLEDLEGSQSFIQHNERLEFLGDAILEFVCSTHLYFLFPESNEGSLVSFRSSLVQNKYLVTIAKKLELDLFMQFSHGPDLCHEADRDHAMANCFEAILGAIYLDSDVTTVRRIFSKHVFEESELRELWNNLEAHPLQTQKPTGDRDLIPCSDVLKKLVKFEESVGVRFDHIRLLAKAFTHPQVAFNNLTFGNNQRMEFLGDSVVQWVVTDYLYRHFPEHHEGHLTLLRSSLVNRNIQAKIAGEIGLNQHVNFGLARGTPKLRQKQMADLFEAFLAALFVDKGIKPVEVFCKVCLFPRLTSVITKQEWIDAKSQLQSCCLAQSQHGDGVPFYKILKNVGSPNMKLYTVGVYYRGKRLGTGHSDNVHEAEMKAAQNALDTNYFPELGRQKKVLHQKHKKLKLEKQSLFNG